MVALVPVDPVRESGIALLFLIYVIAILFVTKILYGIMRRRGLEHNVAVYYNRKFIHVFAGGVVALFVPFVFSSPTIPLILALVLSLLVYLPHKTGKILEWFQVKDNMFEVNFTLMWGIGLFLLWILFDDPFLAIIPPVFMAMGDAVTGVIRNLMFKRRTKHWIGNIFMAMVTVPLGYIYGGIPGAVAGVVAAFIERYEFPPIDDNVLITLSSILVLSLWHFSVI